MTFDWLKAAPWILVILLLLGMATTTHLYMSERDAFTALKAQIKLLSEQAVAENARVKKLYSENLDKVKADYEKNIPTVRTYAVSNYRLRYPTASCSTVPGAPSSEQVDDGAGKERLVDKFPADCGDDANKLEAWRAWATLNQIPIED